MEITETLYVKSRSDWQDWLQANNTSKQEIWLIYYKKHTGKPRIPYNDAVEEALCFGWIDSTVKRVDEETYVQKFTPRKSRSLWSVLNKERAEKMIQTGLMTPTGLEKIKEAKNNGRWEEAYTSKKKVEIPADLSKALKSDQKANINFRNFADSYQNLYIDWINYAKKEETRQRRIKEVVERASENQKPGMM